jgi:hypothetical protein
MERQDGSLETDSQSVVGKGVRQETHFVPEMPRPRLRPFGPRLFRAPALPPCRPNWRFPCTEKIHPSY